MKHFYTNKTTGKTATETVLPQQQKCRSSQREQIAGIADMCPIGVAREETGNERGKVTTSTPLPSPIYLHPKEATAGKECKPERRSE
ncbi:hypothetical protein TNCV_3029791 [Trichonephila clavipes]|nr:hypothetical protein TNCV_3029791 [Trichonephila clavipes]